MARKGRKGFGPFNVSAREAEAEMEEYRRRYESGDKTALLEAVEYCLFNRVIAPQWIVRAFCDSVGRWQALLVPSLDAGFALPKRKHLRAQFKRNQIAFEVYGAVEHAKRAGIPVDDNLFETIGEVIGEELKVGTIGKTMVKKCLKAARQELKEQIAEQKRRNPKPKGFVNVYSTNAAIQDRLARVIEALPKRNKRRKK